jgi:predicted enzyme related to lactoylglutathione lyase
MTPMAQPVTYAEIHSPDLEASRAFFAAAFGWDLRPFAAPDYLVAPHGDGAGIDTGLLASRDGQPRTVPIIRVGPLDEAIPRVEASGGKVVVPPFSITGVGHGCYVVDPTGVLIGLHAYDAHA